MYPELTQDELKHLESPAEAELYKLFEEGTPNNWFICHGVDLLIRKRGEKTTDGECDFIVFAPEWGMLAIEAKGGVVERDVHGKWTSTSSRGTRHILKRSPLTQAKSARKNLHRHLKSHGLGSRGTPQLLTGHAVFFPETEQVEGILGPDWPPELLGLLGHKTSIMSWVEGVFQYWATNDTDWVPLSVHGIERVSTLLSGPIRIRPLLSKIISQEAAHQVELTKRQARFLQNLRLRNRATIAGGAGTGKTLIALQHAKELAALGLRTLLVCYNRALADFLERQILTDPKPDIWQYHRLCEERVTCARSAGGVDLLAKAREELPGADSFHVLLPMALALSTRGLPDFRYDAILVDEAQDFRPEYFLPLERLLADRETSRFYVFLDPNQRIYQCSTALPIPGPPLVLTDNCRNTRPIHEAAYTFYGGAPVAPPEIAGGKVCYLSEDTPQAQAQSIRALVAQLIMDEEVSPEEVAVLVAGDGKDAYFRALLQAGRPANSKWSIEEHWVPGKVVVDTARRYKGLEAKVVILWCSEGLDFDNDVELLYVGLSRACSRLWVVSTARLRERLVESGAGESEVG